LALAPRATALRARVGDDAALAPAAVAGGDVDELSEDTLLHAAHLARAVATGAPFGLAARLGAEPAAVGALLGAADLDLLLGAEDRLFERERHRVAQVGAALRAAPLAGGAAEEGVEDVAEAAEVAEALEAAARLLAHARPAEAVVGGPFLRIGEDFERLVDLFKARLGPVLFVAVGVVLHRQPAEGLFDLFLAGGARHPEHLVVVLLLRRHLCLVRLAAALRGYAKNGPRKAAPFILPATGSTCISVGSRTGSPHSPFPALPILGERGDPAVLRRECVGLVRRRKSRLWRDGRTPCAPTTPR